MRTRGARRKYATASFLLLFAITTKPRSKFQGNNLSQKPSDTTGTDRQSSEPGPVAAEIRALLNDAFAPDHLEIIDESALHKGHKGARSEGESHFRVAITSARFAEMSRVERQRAVHHTLDELLKDRIHALSITANTT